MRFAPPERRVHAPRQLLQRWLRDSEHRGAWETWVEEVEESVDLSAWAKGRPGLSFGFPHLVQLRWNEVLASFEEAAPKSTTSQDK